jgi:hypothetical protein
MSLGDLLPALLSFLLTVAVLSYLWQDNIFFRLAIHLFVGVAAGYAGAVAINNVIYPRLVYPLFTSNLLDFLVLAFPPLILGLLLFAKLSPRLAWLGNPTMAFLVGVGAAAAIGGAVLGTLFPQIQAATTVANLDGGVLLAGTLLTLVYFQFSVRSRPDEPARRNPIIEALGWGGQLFIAVTFGVIFAGVYASALAALVERSTFVIQFLRSLIS